MSVKSDENITAFLFAHIQELQGHVQKPYLLSWSPNGCWLLVAARDGQIELWQLENEHLTPVRSYASGLKLVAIAWSPDSACLTLLGRGGGQVWRHESGELMAHLPPLSDSCSYCCVAWSPDGRQLVVAADDKTLRLWDVATAEQSAPLIGHTSSVRSVTWSPDGTRFVSGGEDGSICLWKVGSPEPLRTCHNHLNTVTCLLWLADEYFVSACLDQTIKLWDSTGQLQETFEGYPEGILAVAFFSDPVRGQLLVVKLTDGSLELLAVQSKERSRFFKEPSLGRFSPSLTLHPTRPLWVTLGRRHTELVLYRMNLERSFQLTPLTRPVVYANAKVVIIGGRGTGKSTLNLVLTGQPFSAVIPQGKFQVHLFERQERLRADGNKEVLEAFLWDMNSDPGYRLIHQFYLHETTVALLVLDTRSESDPIEDIREWARVLRVVQGLKGGGTTSFAHVLLVISRIDTGGSGVYRRRLEELQVELDSQGIYETSAKECWGIEELIAAIKNAIDWDSLPRVYSTSVIQEIKELLLTKGAAGQQLCTEGELYKDFLTLSSVQGLPVRERHTQFETSLGRVEAQGLMRRLSNNYLLLLPDLLDIYLSAVLTSAYNDPDGLGSMSEDDILRGKIFVPEPVRIEDQALERALLSSLLNDFLRYEMAFSEVIEGTQPLRNLLIFPSQSKQNNPDLPNQEKVEVIFHVEGDIQRLYTTLAVRLARSGIFRRKELWKNAITYVSGSGEICGISISTRNKVEAELFVFFQGDVSVKTCFDFASYVYWHLKTRGKIISIERFLHCAHCRASFTPQQVKERRALKETTILCPACEKRTVLPSPDEPFVFSYSPVVQQIDQSADEQLKRETLRAALQRRKETEDYDAFICYNTIDQDENEVEYICQQLEEEGVLPFRAKVDVAPGTVEMKKIEEILQKVRVSIVCIGNERLDEQQQTEVYALLKQAIKRNHVVIPVVLSHVSAKEPALPLLLQGTALVDFRKWKPNPIKRLIEGITKAKHANG